MTSQYSMCVCLSTILTKFCLNVMTSKVTKLVLFTNCPQSVTACHLICDVRQSDYEKYAISVYMSRLQPSGMWRRVVCQTGTITSEGPAASVFTPDSILKSSTLKMEARSTSKTLVATYNTKCTQRIPEDLKSLQSSPWQPQIPHSLCYLCCFINAKYV
jgi:hypothetical protein